MFKVNLKLVVFAAALCAAQAASAESYYYPKGGQNGCGSCKKVVSSACHRYNDLFYIVPRAGVTNVKQKGIFEGDTGAALTYGGAVGLVIPRAPVRLEAELMTYEMEYAKNSGGAEANVYNWMGNVYVDLYSRCTNFSAFIFGGTGIMSFDGDAGNGDYWAYQAGGGLAYRFARPVAAEVRYAYQGLVKRDDRRDNVYGFNHAHQVTGGIRIYF